MFNKLFSENSEISIMRIMSLLGTITGIAIAFVGIFLNRDLMGISTLVGVFMGSSFAGKAVQKISEIKGGMSGKD